MKHFFTLFFVMCLSFAVYAQRNTGINTINPSSKAALDVHTDQSFKQGILVPRLSVADTTALQIGIPNHSKGLLFYDTVNTVYRYWTGSKWQAFGGGSSSLSDWSLSGNTLVPVDTQSTGFKYLGTNSPFPLIIATDGQQRMRISRTGNIGIGMNPTSGIPLSLKSNGLGQVFSIVRSTTGNLFEFRQDANENAKLQMYDKDGGVLAELNGDTAFASFFNTKKFGIGTSTPSTYLEIAGDLATQPKSMDLSANDVYYSLPTKGTSLIYVNFTATTGAKIHGMGDGVLGKHLYISNRFTYPIIFIENSIEATTPDRITTGSGDFEIATGQTAHFIYVGNRWRLVSAPSSSGGSSLNGTGLGNKVAFWTANNTLGQNTLFHWENASQSLGIGWAAPIAPLHLHVAGNLPIYQAYTNVTTGITSATDGFWVGVNAAGTAELIQKEAFPLTFATSNLERVRIASNGNVGIGVTNPSARLAVYQAGDGEISIEGANTNWSTLSLQTLGVTGTAPIGTAGTKGWRLRAIADGNGLTAQRNHLNFQFWNGNGGTSFFSMTSLGNLGIGTVTPQNKLDVSGGVAVGSTYAGTSIAPTNGLIVQGNVGIGTNAPAYRLDVGGSAKIGGDLNVDASQPTLRWRDASGTQLGYIQHNTNLQIDASSGDIAIGGTNLYVDRTNNRLGVGTNAPATKLDVEGTFKLGAIGSNMNEIVKATISANLPAIAAATALAQSFTFPGGGLTAVGSTVIVSPQNQLNLLIGSARVVNDTTIEVVFYNPTAAPVNVPAMSFYFTIIR